MQGLYHESGKLYVLGAGALGFVLGIHPLVPFPPFYTWLMLAPLTVGGAFFAPSLLRQKRHPAVAFAVTAVVGLLAFGMLFGAMRAIVAAGIG